MLLTKNIIQVMLNIFTFCLKKSNFFSERGGGVDPPPLIACISAKKSKFFYALPKGDKDHMPAPRIVL